ncbi:MAG: hypothetical protein QM648_11170 [Solirubrobacterales bacterium]
MRPRVPGEGDPRVAYGVLAALGVLLLLVVVSITLSNRAKTLNDEAAAISAEADQRKAAVAVVPTTVDDVTDRVQSQTLLVGGLAAVRFPWNTAMKDLSKSLPDDVTLDSLNATSAAASAPGTATTTGGSSTQPVLTLMGCTSGWVGYARLLTWLRQMPGVASVKSTTTSEANASSSGDSTDAGAKRKDNCGPAPLAFGVNISYVPKTADLLGLPRPAAAPAGATGATSSAAGTPAASTTGG